MILNDLKSELDAALNQWHLKMNEFSEGGHKLADYAKLEHTQRILLQRLKIKLKQHEFDEANSLSDEDTDSCSFYSWNNDTCHIPYNCKDHDHAWMLYHKNCQDQEFQKKIIEGDFHIFV